MELPDFILEVVHLQVLKHNYFMVSVLSQQALETY
jgi:hypothetical protein